MVSESLPFNNTLIVIVGPTAVGKTSVSTEVAKQFNTEIISADSRQFYRGLTIGTAAPSAEQLSSVKHHFIAHLDPADSFNVSVFETSVNLLLSKLFEKHHVVIMTGGSGLYIKAVCEGIDEFPNIDNAIREQLLELNQKEGLPALRSLLMKYDPVYYAKVDLANPTRIIRALEVSMQTGMPYSSQLKNNVANRNYNIIKIALNIPRNELHNRINRRVDQMIEDGLIEEARSFYGLRHLNSLNTVGYRELFDYFDNKCTLNEAIEKIKTNTRRYARRQITWFRKDPGMVWLQPDSQIVINHIVTTLKRVN